MYVLGIKFDNYTIAYAYSHINTSTNTQMNIYMFMLNMKNKYTLCIRTAAARYSNYKLQKQNDTETNAYIDKVSFGNWNALSLDGRNFNKTI